jgi:hypothetical protein
MSGDDITPEQHLGDITAAVLDQLKRSRGEFACVGTSLAILAQHSGDPHLAEAAEAARLLAGQLLIERVRDVAATLPFRGLEFE